MGRLNSGVRRQKSVWLLCFSARCPCRLRSALLFGKIAVAYLLRSSSSGALNHHMRCARRLRMLSFAFVLFAGSRCGRFGDGRGKFAGRAPASRLRLSASPPRLHPRRVPSRLTSRSSRPRVVAAAMCFALRLHMSAAPPQGGLTQALGGRKAFAGFASQCSFSHLRSALLFVLFPAALLLRSSLSGALTHCRRRVGRLRKR
jgi:hypothetical protein